MNMDALLIIFFVVFTLVIAFKHRSFDNFQFILCLIILLELLYYFYTTSKCKQNHETFIVGYDNMIDFNLYNQKLFNLPTDVKNMLLPKLDYVISKFKPNDKSNESLEDTSMESLDEMSYVTKKDPYVTKQDGDKVVIDQAKMKKMRDEYISLDKMLNDLKQNASSSYKQLFEDVNSAISKKSLT